MSDPVLTLVERDGDGLSKMSAETLTFSRGLAEAAGTDLHAVVVGELTDAMTELLRVQGVATVHRCDHELFAEYAPAAIGEALAQLHGQLTTCAIVAPGTDRGAEVMAHLAARTDLPLAANCTAIQPADGGWDLTRVRWGGVLLEDAHLEATAALVTVAPHQTVAAPAEVPGDAEVVDVTPSLGEELAVGRVRDVASLGAGISLATAPVVVSGGRGVGSAEGFAVLEELAGLIGGAVGCSRVATNNGWRSHNDQVGQTGTRVAPDLYIACGISGATQHWVGCMSSKKILAINTDTEAPMVVRADYAVVGDLHEILPAIVEEVRARKGA